MKVHPTKPVAPPEIWFGIAWALAITIIVGAIGVAVWNWLS